MEQEMGHKTETSSERPQMLFHNLRALPCRPQGAMGGEGAVEQSCGRMCVPERKQLVSI